MRALVYHDKHDIRCDTASAPSPGKAGGGISRPISSPAP